MKITWIKTKDNKERIKVYKQIRLSPVFQRLADSTKEAYMQILTRFFKWIKEKRFKNPQKVSKKDIKEYINQYESKSKETLKLNKNGILFYYNQIMGRNYKIRVHGQPAKKSFPIINRQQMIEMLKQTKRAEDKLLLKFLYSTGVRVSEVSNLKSKDVFQKQFKDLTRGTIINGKGAKDRYFYMAKQLGEEIQQYLLERSKHTYQQEYLFLNRKGNNKRSVRTIQNLVKRVSKKAGLDRITPHSFRRSFATSIHEDGTPLKTIASFLGHNSISTTERYIQNGEKAKLISQNPLNKFYNPRKINKSNKVLNILQKIYRLQRKNQARLSRLERILKIKTLKSI